MAHITGISSNSPVYIPPTVRSRQGCSLRRICTFALSSLGLYLARQLTVFPDEIARSQSSVYQPRPCESFCDPGPLASHFGSTRVRGAKAQTTKAESLVVHPGIISLKNDPDKGYVNRDGNFKGHARHIKMVKEVYKQVRSMPEIQETEMNAEIEDSAGFGIDAEEPRTKKITRCLYGMNPQKVENHKKATEHLQTWIQNLDQLSEKNICDELRQGHKILMTRVGSKKAGKYRHQMVIVYKDPNQESSIDGLSALIRSQGGTEKQVRILRNQILPKFRDDIHEFTAEERVVVDMIGYLTPAPNKIEPMMTQYAKNLKAMAHQMKYCEDFDPIAFASYAHQEMGKIHPFEDGNGRMARLMMNGILREAGYQPVVFPSEDEYTEAVIRDAKEPGHFAAYLREKAIPDTERQFGPGQPCLPELTC